MQMRVLPECAFRQPPAEDRREAPEYVFLVPGPELSSPDFTSSPKYCPLFSAQSKLQPSQATPFPVIIIKAWTNTLLFYKNMHL